MTKRRLLSYCLTTRPDLIRSPTSPNCKLIVFNEPGDVRPANCPIASTRSPLPLPPTLLLRCARGGTAKTRILCLRRRKRCSCCCCCCSCSLSVSAVSPLLSDNELTHLMTERRSVPRKSSSNSSLYAHSSLVALSRCLLSSPWWRLMTHAGEFLHSVRV